MYEGLAIGWFWEADGEATPKRTKVKRLNSGSLARALHIARIAAKKSSLKSKLSVAIDHQFQ